MFGPEGSRIAACRHARILPAGIGAHFRVRVADKQSVNTSVQHQPLLSPQEAATRLSVSVMTVRRLVKAGQLPALKVGGQLRFDPSELEEWLEESHVNPSERNGERGPE
jgi:excisionase family DNA binding protein